MDRLTAVRSATGLASVISMGDVFVFAGNIAIELASTLSTRPGVADAVARQGLDPVVSPLFPLILPLAQGRVDATNCTGIDEAALPKTSFVWSQIAATFGRFGMNSSEIAVRVGGGGREWAMHVCGRAVCSCGAYACASRNPPHPRTSQAIMGAHTLGKCSAANSGIEGSWVGTALSFSTDYFKKLLFIGWDRSLVASVVNVALSPDVWTNGPNGRTVMLRTDVELLFNTTNAQGTDACNRFNGIGQGSNAPVPQGRCPFQVRVVGCAVVLSCPARQQTYIRRGQWDVP